MVTGLCSSPPDPVISSPSIIHERLWKNIYDGVEGNDSDAIALLVSVVAHVAHVDDLKSAAFAQLKTSAPCQAALGALNGSLSAMRSGFRDVLSRYTDLSLASAALDLLEQENVVQHVVYLMFSPVEALQEAAQGLVALAYDVDGRTECFRALLEHFPGPSMTGIMDFLQTYTRYATSVPEACSLSQALARCLTDVIDGLCSSPSGLLLQDAFLKSAGEVLEDKVPKWWHLMTEALCVIFKYTPTWATYFDNEVMVLWMRDALIFGRDLLAQRRTLETAALARTQKDMGGKRRMSAVGKKMVDDLQQVLYELTKWLRLTDEELLHQSFALLESLLECFRSTTIRPRADTFQRIQRHVDDARKNDPNRLKSRLDNTRVLRLQEALAEFEEDDDDVQIIEHSFAPPKALKVAKAGDLKLKPDEKVKTEPRHILKISKDTKGKVPERKSSIASYFSTGDQKKPGAGSRAAGPSTLSKMGPPSARPYKPIIKDESVKSSTPTVESSSSEEEESDEDDEGPKGLGALSTLQRTPTIKKPAERRQVKILDMPINGKNSKLEQIRKREDARRTHLRLKPDVSALYRTLLLWNYDHDGPSPPGDGPRLSPIPASFRDYVHFRNVFEPILFLELWNQLVESKENPMDTYECRILSRQYIDDHIDVEISIDGSVQKDWSLNDTDIVLLRSPNAKRRVLAKVQSYRSSFMGIQGTIRYMTQGGDAGLQVGTSWSIGKVLRYAFLKSPYDTSLTHNFKSVHHYSRVCCPHGASALRSTQ